MGNECFNLLECCKRTSMLDNGSGNVLSVAKWTCGREKLRPASAMPRSARGGRHHELKRERRWTRAGKALNIGSEWTWSKERRRGTMNMNRRVLTLMVTCIALLGLLTAACGAPATAVPAATQPPATQAPATQAPATEVPAATGSKVIVFLVANLTSPFFSTMVAGATAEAKTQGYTVQLQNANNDPNLQGSQADDAIAKKVAAIIMNPVDSKGLVPFCQKARAAGIIVVAADRNMDCVQAYVETDNTKMGQMAGEEMVKLLTARYGAPRGTIAELQGTAGFSTTPMRHGGFADVIAKYPNIKVVASPDTQHDTDKAFAAAQNILTANPGLDGFYSHADAIGEGAVRAVQAAGNNKKVGETGHIIEVMIDGDDWALGALRDGTIDADLSQDPTGDGATAVDDIFKLIAGQSVQATIELPPVLVEKANAGDKSLWGNQVLP